MIGSTYDPTTGTLTVVPNQEDPVLVERKRCLEIANEIAKLHPTHAGIARTIAFLIEKGKAVADSMKGTPEWRKKCGPDGQC